jgi:carbon storage regulator
MLVLSRRAGERIMIDTGRERITITLIEVRDNGQVRLGIEAPRAVEINREEVLEREKEGRHAKS